MNKVNKIMITQNNNKKRFVSYGLAGILSVLVPNAFAAEAAKDCSLDDCKTESGFVVRMISEGESENRSNGTGDMSKDRRVDVRIEAQGESQDDENPQARRAEVAGNFMVYLPQGGVFWATEDPAVNDPRLSVNATNRIKFEDNKILEPVRFNYYNNYSAFIDRMEVTVYRENDTDLVEPIATFALPVQDIGTFEWDGQFDDTEDLRKGDTLLYVLRAFDAEGRMDETSIQRFQLLSPEEIESDAAFFRTDADSRIAGANNAVNGGLNTQSQELGINENFDPIEQIIGRNSLVRQNIPIYGSRVRIFGQDLPEGYALDINGQQFPIDIERKIAAEFLLPVGSHQFDLTLTKDGEVVERQLAVDVTGEHMFLVAIADLTASENKTSGSIEPLSADDRYDDDLLIEGRAAFYLKGKIKGKYLITAQADTQERELEDLFDGFLDKDPQDIFRRLDPDRYYPVYGDDSTTYRDVDTQGRFYVRVDWDKSQALWGNYNTGITGTEFAQYNRSLYGAAINWRSLDTTELGESQTQAIGFVSEAQTALGHSEFLGTGGSLYFLRHTDILPGSDIVVVEVRDRDSGRVVERINLVRGADYEIDEIQGRIILTRPLTQINRENVPSIIRDEPLDGSDVILLVDYEYRPDGFDGNNVTGGGRVKHWFGEHLAVGVTHVEEKRDGDDYQLSGVDVTLQAGRGTYLKVEAARSESTQSSVFFSDNGGLSFVELNPEVTGQDDEGDAISVEARANFKELGWTENEVTAAAWSRETDEGFSIARRDTNTQITEQGAEITGEFSDDLRVTARATSLERDDDQKLEQANVLVDYQFNDTSAMTAEIRQVEETTTANGSVDGLLGAVQYRHRFGSKFELFGTAQFTIDSDDAYENNDLFTLGGKYLFAERSSIGAEYTTGARGDAAAATFDYQINNDHNVYGRYSYSTDRTATLFNPQDTGFTLGHRSRITSQVTIFNEAQQLRGNDYTGHNQVFGLDYNPAEGWLLGFSLQQGDLEATTGDVDREAYTITGGFRDPDTEWASKFEYRRDEGAEQRDQRLTTNRLIHKFSESWRMAAKYNYADTDDRLNPDADTKFIEGSVGFAYRPVTNNRWNALGKYTYLEDLRSLGQIDSGLQQRSDIFSLEGVYHISKAWEMAGKLGRRTGEVRELRNAGQWFESTTNFAAIQARYHLVSEWDGIIEHRWLEVEEDDSIRKGWLIGVDRHIGEHFKVGIGYNFTDFSDDLSDLDYDYSGWYINLVGKY